MNEEIIKLTKIWYRGVGLNHHKDRDCHWYINKTWSYGENPYYRVEHYGYIYDFEDSDNKWDTYEKAEEYLLEVIKQAFKKEIDWSKEVMKNPKDWDEEQVKQAKFWLDSQTEEKK